MNHFVHERSPYLLQRKNNAVDGYPCGTDSLQNADNEEKLIILSIGYSALNLPEKSAQAALKLLI
jgi:uncharacterized protein YyaL (SSP411 family)